jgi:hypothetical protein
MSHYPFDYQKCLAHIVMKGKSGYFVDLIEENVTYTGPPDMKQYIIEGVTFADNKIVSKIPSFISSCDKQQSFSDPAISLDSDSDKSEIRTWTQAQT